jgi:hypothetical protein
MRTAQIGATMALAVHALSAAGLAVGYWLAQSFYSSSLITDPTRTLRFLTVIFSIFKLVYSAAKNANHNMGLNDQGAKR